MLTSTISPSWSHVLLHHQRPWACNICTRELQNIHVMLIGQDDLHNQLVIPHCTSPLQKPRVFRENCSRRASRKRSSFVFNKAEHQTCASHFIDNTGPCIHNYTQLYTIAQGLAYTIPSHFIGITGPCIHKMQLYIHTQSPSRYLCLGSCKFDGSADDVS